MATRALRLSLSLLVALAVGTNRLPAQDVVPPAQAILVVPALHLEPAAAPPSRPSPITPVDFQEPSDAPATAPEVDFRDNPGGAVHRFWVRGDYMLWGVTGAPVAVPLLTTNTALAIGALNEPGTRVLFGAGSGQDTHFGAFSGGQLSVGWWFDDKAIFDSIDANAFVLENRSIVVRANSAGGTAPIVSIPFNATQAFGPLNPAGETALNSGRAPTTATVELTSQFWGADANLALDLLSGDNFYWLAVVGFRYLDLSEGLNLRYTTLSPTPGAAVSVTDDFGTSNQFYGGQLGTRAVVSLGRWQLDTAATLALGYTHEVLNINGATTVTNGAFGFASGATPGGVFAEPSNIGTTSRNIFTAVPELHFKARFELTPQIRPFIAYNVLYVSNVIRPGNQIDRNINPTQNAFFVPPGTLVGAAAPAPTFHGSDFWAQGLQVGLEIRY